MAWTAPRTWVTSEVVTAAVMNTHVRDNLNWLGRVGVTGWASYTPTWTSTGTAPVIGNGTLLGVYVQIGRLFIATIQMIAGSTTTFGTGTYRWASPVSMSTSGGQLSYGSAKIADTGTTDYEGIVKAAASTTVRIYASGAEASATSPMTPANGDVWEATYTAQSSS